MDINTYKSQFSRPRLIELPNDEVDANLRTEANKALKMKKKDLKRA